MRRNRGARRKTHDFRQSVDWLFTWVRIHPFDNYDIWPGSRALMNREPITLRNLLMRARLQPSMCGVIIESVYFAESWTRDLFHNLKIIPLHYIALQRGDQLFTRVRILLNHDPVTYFTTSKQSPFRSGKAGPCKQSLKVIPHNYINFICIAYTL
jgi:hypothetical protein